MGDARTSLGSMQLRLPGQIKEWPPRPPPRDARRLGPQRYDMSRELRPKGTAYVGATPVADHPVEPFGIVTNLNQDLTK